MEVEAPSQLLVAGADLAQPELFDLASGRAALYSARSPDKDSGNEDAVGVFAVDGSRALLVVADGMGGAAAGARASSEALNAVRRSVRGATTRKRRCGPLCSTPSTMRTSAYSV